MITEHIGTAVVERTVPPRAAPDPEPTDDELLTRYLTHRDEPAFTAIFRRHCQMVFEVGHRVLRNRHDAEDVLQATFLVLAVRAAAVRPGAPLANWLYGVAFRTSLELRRANARRFRNEKELRAGRRHPLTFDAPHDELAGVLGDEIDRLPQKYRVLVVLCDLEGQPRGEVARRLRLSEGVLSYRLNVGRRLLARRLRRRGAIAAVLIALFVTPPAMAVVPPPPPAVPTRAGVRSLRGGGAAAVSTTAAARARAVERAPVSGRLKSVFTAAVVLPSALGLLLLILHLLSAPQLDNGDFPVPPGGTPALTQPGLAVPVAPPEKGVKSVAVRLDGEVPVDLWAVPFVEERVGYPPTTRYVVYVKHALFRIDHQGGMQVSLKAVVMPRTGMEVRITVTARDANGRALGAGSSRKSFPAVNDPEAKEPVLFQVLLDPPPDRDYRHAATVEVVVDCSKLHQP